MLIFSKFSVRNNNYKYIVRNNCEMKRKIFEYDSKWIVARFEIVDRFDQQSAI